MWRGDSGRNQVKEGPCPWKQVAPTERDREEVPQSPPTCLLPLCMPPTAKGEPCDIQGHHPPSPGDQSGGVNLLGLREGQPVDLYW